METGAAISEAKKGNVSAQKFLFDMYADKMIMLCRRYLKITEDAEEVMLDGFYKFFKTLHSFRYESDAALFSWLKRIMINECLMFLRKKNVFSIVTENAAEGIMIREDILERLAASDIFKLILQLPVGYRTVFNLHVVEGENHKTIAGLLGITEGTSKSQLNKAKALLQKMLLKQDINYVSAQRK